MGGVVTFLVYLAPVWVRARTGRRISRISLFVFKSQSRFELSNQDYVPIPLEAGEGRVGPGIGHGLSFWRAS